MSRPLSCIVLIAVLATGPCYATPAATYFMFHVPHASQTTVYRINNSNIAVGLADYSESRVGQAFIRAADGTITTFNVDGQDTYAFDISNSGLIVGSYTDASAVTHGFVH